MIKSGEGRENEPTVVLRTSVATDYPDLLPLPSYLQLKREWGVEHFLLPLFQSANEEFPVVFSDRLLTNQEWTHTFVGKVNDVICSSSSVPFIEESLRRQLSWASHLGLRLVVVPHFFLESLGASNLARLLVRHLHQMVEHQILMVTVVADSAGWKSWHDIQRHCDFHPYIGINLVLSQLPPPAIPESCQMWISEPVRYISVDCSLFVSNDSGYPVLPKIWQHCLQQFMAHNVHVLLTGRPVISPPTDDDTETHTMSCITYYVQYLRYLQHQAAHTIDIRSRRSYGYWDALQSPLQPLSDHLEACTYEVFEQDSIKYQQYEAAIVNALRAIRPLSSTAMVTDCAITSVAVVKEEEEEFGVVKHSSKKIRVDNGNDNSVVVAVLGAGRGPLVAATLSAAKTTQTPVRVYVVEKNPNAVLTLRLRAQTDGWPADSVLVVESDARSVRLPEAVDILVSELLGSFGCNELSPECLYGAEHLWGTNQRRLSVPTSYRACLQPISAAMLWMTARGMHRGGGAGAGAGAGGGMQHVVSRSGLETPYVVYLRRCCALSEHSEVAWEFEHPHLTAIVLPSSSSSTGCSLTRRHALLRFTVTEAGMCHGFAGTFDCCLFEDVTLSIRPESHTPTMGSWYPVYFPLLQPVQVAVGDEIVVEMWRCGDAHAMWYEWCLLAPQCTAVQNIGGRSARMLL